METGPTTPSREMVLRIGVVLDLPLRDRNALLAAAGYAPLYRETGLQSDEMEIARGALERILAQQEPYPALVMNGEWDFVMANSGVRKISDVLLGDDSNAQAFTNALHLLFSPDGLQPFVSNWEDVASVILSRVQRESAARPAGQSLLQSLLRYPTIPENWHLRAAMQACAPVLELAIEKADLRLRFFTTLTTFGTPQDVTLQELRIECYFPSDDATRRFFTAA